MQISKVSILGVGLLGGSIGLAVQSRISGCKVVGYAHRPGYLDEVLKYHVVQEGFESVEQTVDGADLVVICSPVGLVEPLLKQMAPVLKPGALVTDVGSTKRTIVDAGDRLMAGRFVGSHPMAGSEKRGVEFARTDLFERALCILTPSARTDPDALCAVESFWKTLNMRTVRLDPMTHDRLLAGVSHLPHALAAAVVAMQEEAALSLAGKGFIDFTRIAGGAGSLWRDILSDNRDAVKAAIKRLRLELDRLETLLEPSQAMELTAWLDAAAKRREALVREKISEMNPD